MKFQNHNLLRCFVTLPAALCLLSLTGCTHPKVTRWNLQMTAKTAAAVRLDVVGINFLDKQDWAAASVDDYWKPNNPMRTSAERLTFEIVGGTIRFVETTVAGAEKGLTGSGTGSVMVTRTSTIWDQWKARNVVGLVVIGYFPGDPPTPDRRKQMIPLYKEVWDTKDTLKLEIQDGRIQVATPPTPEAAKYPF